MDLEPSLPRLRPGSPLLEAAEHFRHFLERNRRPKNTIDAYMFDLAVLARAVPTKSINQISGADISRFLADANSTATRKRRLTSVRQFYRYLNEDVHVLSGDPTVDVYPNRIELRDPEPLSADEQASLLLAATADEPWSLLAILLMMQVGLSRSEILALDRGSIDRSDPVSYAIQIASDDLRKPTRTRTLQTNQYLAEVYEAYLMAMQPDGRLFPIGFQAINGMVNRLRRRAGIERAMSPRTLRETFIARRFTEGATEEEILSELGMAADLRNRQSIRRFKPKSDQDPPVSSS